MSSENPVLTLDAVSKTFPVKGGRVVHAVSNVSLKLLPNEKLALVGESGCGKSTLANLAIRLERADSGRVLLGDEDITHLSERRLRPLRKDIQMVFQDAFASLNPRRSVGDSIADSVKIHAGLRRDGVAERTQELLRLVGLSPEMATRFPHQFSGGQRQRICIARALASRPKVVIADEATSALDVSVRANILDLFLDLQEEMPMAYLFVSHDLAVVERIADRVAVMYLGQIVELGTRRQVFENPQHPYTRLLLNAVPVADPRQRIRKEIGVSRHECGLGGVFLPWECEGDGSAGEHH